MILRLLYLQHMEPLVRLGFTYNLSQIYHLTFQASIALWPIPASGRAVGIPPKHSRSKPSKLFHNKRFIRSHVFTEQTGCGQQSKEGQTLVRAHAYLWLKAPKPKPPQTWTTRTPTLPHVHARSSSHARTPCDAAMPFGSQCIGIISIVSS